MYGFLDVEFKCVFVVVICMVCMYSFKFVLVFDKKDVMKNCNEIFNGINVFVVKMVFSFVVMFIDI